MMDALIMHLWANGYAVDEPTVLKPRNLGKSTSPIAIAAPRGNGRQKRKKARKA